MRATGITNLALGEIARVGGRPALTTGPDLGGEQVGENRGSCAELRESDAEPSTTRESRPAPAESASPFSSHVSAVPRPASSGRVSGSQGWRSHREAAWPLLPDYLRPGFKIVTNEEGELEQEGIKILQTEINASTFAYIEGSELSGKK